MSNIPVYISNTNSSEDSRRYKIVLEKLQKRGYTFEAICQAIAATALAGDRTAAAWLSNHFDDPSLGGCGPREFYLYLCPVGPVEACFHEFWSRYRAARGWCASMDYVPHATLVEPFEVAPSGYLDLLRAFNTAARLFAGLRLVRQLRLLPSTIHDQHLGFVIDAEPALTDLAKEFAAACSRVNLRVTVRQPPHKLSLCCGFQQAQYLQVQKEISEHFRLDPTTGVVLPDNTAAAHATAAAAAAAIHHQQHQAPDGTRWQLRLYSRDCRLMNGLTRQLHPLYRLPLESTEAPISATSAADTPDELRFNCGDRVALVAQGTPPRHGWGLGFNVETGVMGNFPLLLAQRIPCGDAWTLHREVSMQVAVSSVGDMIGGGASARCPPAPLPTPQQQQQHQHQQQLHQQQHHQQPSLGNGVNRGGSGSSSGGGGFDAAPISPASSEGSASSASASASASASSASVFFAADPAELLQPPVILPGAAAIHRRNPHRRQIHIIRHAETLDHALGPDWTAHALDASGRLVARFDLNIPPVLPARPPHPVESFVGDPPLSTLGQFIANQVGLSMGRAGVRYAQCYSSPALACVQTAHAALLGAGLSAELPIRLEPLLFAPPTPPTPPSGSGEAAPGAYAGYAPCINSSSWMSSEQLREFGYNVDLYYSQLTTVPAADTLTYKERLARVLNRALDSSKAWAGQILIVGHQSTVEQSLAALATRSTSGGGSSSSGAAAPLTSSLMRRSTAVPFCALLCLEERGGAVSGVGGVAGRKGWAPTAPPGAASFILQSHSVFDPTSLLSS